MNTKIGRNTEELQVGLKCWRLFFNTTIFVAITLADYRKRKLREKKIKKKKPEGLFYFLKTVKDKKKIRRKLKNEIREKFKYKQAYIPIKIKG